MKELAHLNKYFYKYRYRFLIGILFVAAQNYFRVLQPQAIRYALDLVVENLGLFQSSDGFVLQTNYYQYLAKILLLFGGAVLILALIMGVFMYFMRQTIIVMSRLIEYDLRAEIYSHYQKLDTAFYKRNNTGDLMARITEDVNKVRMYLGPAVMYGINLFTLFGLVIYSMLSVSVELTLYTLLPLPFLSISIFYVSNLINKKSERIQAQLSNLNSISQEVYSGIRVIKSYVQEEPMLKHFDKESVSFKEKSLSLVRVEALFHPLMILLIGVSTIITIYISGLQVFVGNITPGNIAEFVIYVNMLTWPVTAIGWVASIVQRAAASQKRINEFLKTEPELKNQSTESYHIQGDIQFDKVSFVYPDTGIEALKNVSFHLKKGQRMAIIGKTGSGKTTIADLLVRMYDATSGAIKIDDRAIPDHNMFVLRDEIGYVPQDVFLFSDTVRNNIAFGKKTEGKEVETYAQFAAVHKEILGLSNGYETIVGERGVTLSGGQKQRISIARALIKKPNILILDDCLSAVDTNTEEQILSYFQKELADKTAIIITHRIYALLNFDLIIVLDDGKIIEKGTHQELLANKAFYFDLFEKQKSEDFEIKP